MASSRCSAGVFVSIPGLLRLCIASLEPCHPCITVIHAQRVFKCHALHGRASWQLAAGPPGEDDEKALFLLLQRAVAPTQDFQGMPALKRV